MGILEKIARNSVVTKLEKMQAAPREENSDPGTCDEKKSSTTTPDRAKASMLSSPSSMAAESTGRPIARCVVCQPPYGRHFWRDAYRTWHCTQCDPPAALAFVREEFLFPEFPDAHEIDTEKIILTADGETPEFFQGEWAWLSDGFGNWGWEKTNLAERHRWWRQKRFEDFLDPKVFRSVFDQRHSTKTGASKKTTSIPSKNMELKI